MKHISEEYENLPAWKVLTEVIRYLVNNNDISLMTKEEYVIGYLCKAIYEKLDFEKSLEGK